MARPNTGVQDQLFLHNPVTGQEMVSQAALPESNVNAVNLDDRAVHLLSALAIFQDLDAYGSFGRAMHTQRREAIEKLYGGRARYIAGSIEKGVIKARREARWSFERAAGLGEMIDAIEELDAAGEPRDPKDIRREVRRLQARMSRFFIRFQRNYDGPQNAENREAFQNTLLENLRERQQAVTDSNRAQKRRPHKPRQSGKPFGTRERLQPLKADIRAGFYPSTHREKNEVLEDLDYLDNIKYPLGTPNRLLEIYNHSAREQKRGVVLPDGPERSVLSLTFELLDYFYDARDSLLMLRHLDAAMHEKPDELLSPTRPVSLTEFFDGHQDALVRVVRHLDVDAYAKGMPTRVYNDPLRTVEERWADSGPGVHKRVQDGYVHPRTATQQKRVQNATSDLTVKELRDTVPEAIIDQTKRVLFFAERIQAVAQKLDQQTFKDSRYAAQLALSNIEIEFLTRAA